MGIDLKKKIEELEERRAVLLQAICEDDSVWQPSIIIRIVNEVRSITKILKILKGEEEKWY